MTTCESKLHFSKRVSSLTPNEVPIPCCCERGFFSDTLSVGERW